MLILFCSRIPVSSRDISSSLCDSWLKTRVWLLCLLGIKQSMPYKLSSRSERDWGPRRVRAVQEPTTVGLRLALPRACGVSGGTEGLRHRRPLTVGHVQRPGTHWTSARAPGLPGRRDGTCHLRKEWQNRLEALSFWNLGPGPNPWSFFLTVILDAFL